MRLLENIKKELSNTAITGLVMLCFFGIASIAIVLFLQVSFVTPQKLQADQLAVPAIEKRTLDAFNRELLLNIQTQHAEELKKLDTISQQLQDTIHGEETKQQVMRDLQATLDKVLAQQAARQTTVSAPTAPVRSVNLVYAVDNRWDFSEDEIYNHLLQDHQFDATGYSLEQMTIIHDNLHAGYPALGNTSVPVYYVPQVQYYTTPVTRFRTGLFRSGFCLGGLCP